MASSYPKDIAENLRYRIQVFTECEKDDRLKSIVNELCSRDILYWFNVWCWTYDPRSEGRHLPFVTYPFQDETILQINEAIEKGENVFIDKSRDMGATYMVLYVMLWRWRYKKGENFRIGSRKEDLVDRKGDMDTLFEKLRYQLERLPWWLQPVGFNLGKHGQTYMRILNPENGNSLIGEATNRDFARGGRQKAVLFDEFQAWEQAEEAWRSASDATLCKIPLGTPEGAGNKFAELARGDEIKRKVRLWWWKHPRKSVTTPEHLEKVKRGEVFDKVGKYVVEVGEGECPEGCYVDKRGKIRSDWYDLQHSNRDSDDIAANIDINYLTTGNPIFDTEKCAIQLGRCYEPEYGNLLWRVKPTYNEFGDCVNREQLEVEFIRNPNGFYRVWEHPKKGYDWGYVIGADTAEGLEQGDYDAAVCYFRGSTTPKCVASFRGRIPIHEYAEELSKFGTYFGGALVSVERNNHGHGVLQQLIKTYQRLYHKEIFTKGFAEITDRLGWDTTSMSKPIIVGTLGKAIAQDGFECLDDRFWKETLTFVEDDGKMEAQGKSRGEKCYDDMVMATAICLYTHLQMPLPSRFRLEEEMDDYDRRYLRRKKFKRGNVGFVVC